jgi:UDP-N-acetylglucosamine 2-epimerase (non-hydrolysing)
MPPCRVSDLCCAPIPANAEQLLREGVSPDRIAVTGNTLAETMRTLLPPPPAMAAVRTAHGVTTGRYILATVHRAGTVDDPARLAEVLAALAELAVRAPLLLPLHPHTRRRVAEFGLEPLLAAVRVLPPLRPKDFLALEAGAGLLVSDSGGVQEEAALFGVPLVVLRDSTERPELVGTWCRLVGDRPVGEVLRSGWADAPAWSRAIAAAGPAYPATAAGEQVVAGLDRLLAVSPGERAPEPAGRRFDPSRPTAGAPRR